jgi:hypothetical protein
VKAMAPLQHKSQIPAGTNIHSGDFNNRSQQHCNDAYLYVDVVAFHQY